MSDRTVLQVLVPAQFAPAVLTSNVAQTFEVYQPARAPAWLQDPAARAWNSELGANKDRLLDRASEAIRARLILENAPDAAVKVGSERALEQFPVETLAAFRVRVQHAWDSKPFDGTAHGILEMLNAMGYPQSTLTERLASGWSEFSVQVLATSITDWPGHLTVATKERIVRTILRMKPAHTRLRLVTAGPSSIRIYKQLKWGDELLPAPAKKWGWTGVNSHKRKWHGGAIL